MRRQLPTGSSSAEHRMCWLQRSQCASLEQKLIQKFTVGSVFVYDCVTWYAIQNIAHNSRLQESIVPFIPEKKTQSEAQQTAQQSAAQKTHNNTDAQQPSAQSEKNGELPYIYTGEPVKDRKSSHSSNTCNVLCLYCRQVRCAFCADHKAGTS
jgi:hypothetical protein